MEKLEQELSEQALVLEKLSYGKIASLSDFELLSIIIGRGDVKEQHIVKAKQLFVTYKSLNTIIETNNLALPSNTLTLINAICELNKRMSNCENSIDIIDNNHDAELLIRGLMKGALTEEFWIVAINRGGRVIDKRCISKGGIGSSVVDMRILMKYIIGTLASSVIIAHNHPSGAVNPSNEDIELTKKIVSALSFFDIKLLDHIIIGDKDTYSFRANGII